MSKWLLVVGFLILYSGFNKGFDSFIDFCIQDGYKVVIVFRMSSTVKLSHSKFVR